MYGGFQGGPQLGPPDAERRQSLGEQMLERWVTKTAAIRRIAVIYILPLIRGKNP